MQYIKTFKCSLALTLLILAGCSEAPELSAAKKITTKVAQARELMKNRTTGSYTQAETLLRDALATKGASSIGKQRAHELLATLLSETTARELNELREKLARDAAKQQGHRVESFAEADVNLQRSLSELSTRARALAYVVGLKGSSDEDLQNYRKELLAQIPPAEKAMYEATKTWVLLEQKLTTAKSLAFAAGVGADALLLEAAKANGDEQVSKMKVGAAKRLEADRLAIAASIQESAVLRAKEDEIRRESALTGLRKGLKDVNELIKAHAVTLSKSKLDEQIAQVAAEKSADQLLKHLRAFNELGSELSAAYEKLIARQSEVVRHFQEALKGAGQLRQRFSKFKADQPADAQDDERVEMLVELDEEVGLAVSVSRAQISLAGLRAQKIAVLERVRSRVEQIEQLRKDLAVFGNRDRSAEAATEPGPATVAKRSGGGTSGFFTSLLTSPKKKTPKVEEPLFTAVGLIMDSPGIDTAPIEASVTQAYKAALEDLNSAQRTLWTTALGRLKLNSGPDAVVKKLERAQWNWQVLGMLSLVHEARGMIAERMGGAELAQADAQLANTYLAHSKKARSGVLRQGKSR